MQRADWSAAEASCFCIACKGWPFELRAQHCKAVEMVGVWQLTLAKSLRQRCCNDLPCRQSLVRSSLLCYADVCISTRIDQLAAADAGMCVCPIELNAQCSSSKHCAEMNDFQMQSGSEEINASETDQKMRGKKHQGFAYLFDLSTLIVIGAI